jgi:hypothetical protein
MSQPPKVLFVSYGGGHIGMVLPVMRELEALLPGVQSPLMALTTGHLKAKSTRSDALGYKDFLHLVDAGAARAWGERLSEGNTSPDVPRDETIAYLGINYLDLIAQHGEAGAAELYRTQGRYGFRPLHFMREVMNAVQPDAVVATNSPRSERTALDVAAERGLPAIGMVDLFGLDSDTYVLHEPKPAWTCVISEGVRQRLIARGFPAGGVVVTGNPAFDGLLSRTNEEKARNFIDHQGWQGLTPILWAGHLEPVEASEPMFAGSLLGIAVERLLRDLVRDRDNLALIVRYHPNEWHHFPRAPEQHRVHFSKPSEEPVHPLVLASRAVVVQNSTVGLESAIAGRSVVSLEFADTVKNSFSMATMGVSVPCNRLPDLPSLLNKILSRPEAHAKEFASDGRSAHRVANIVLNALTT